jgi:hypothetical protein
MRIVTAAGAVSLTVAAYFIPVANAGSPTRASWAAAANRDCAAANANVRALPKPTTRRRLIDDVRSTLIISKRVTRQLSLIPSPSRERSAIGKLLANSRRQNSIVQNQLLPALINGSQSRAQNAVAVLDPLGRSFNRMARALGARICAENPEPQG